MFMRKPVLGEALALRQRPRTGSDRHQAGISLLQAADLVRKRLTAVSEPYGTTCQQYNVLRILRGAGEPLPILEIAERMIEQTLALPAC